MRFLPFLGMFLCTSQLKPKKITFQTRPRKGDSKRQDERKLDEQKQEIATLKKELDELKSQPGQHGVVTDY